MRDRKERLEDHLELICCYYNFVRRDRALKFGREVRTPAMQAGLTTRRPTFREIFSSTMSFLALQNITLGFFDSIMLVNVDDSRVSMAAQQHWMAEAPSKFSVLKNWLHPAAETVPPGIHNHRVFKPDEIL